MKKLLFISLLSFVFASCANHGKKIEIEGTKAEIYYKGDAVTESDAKKTGDLLKTKFIKSNDKKASMQLTHENDAYTIRFVYDEEIYKTLKDVDNEFKYLATLASKDIFNGKKVNIALADDQFKDWKTIPYDEAFAKSIDDAGKTNGMALDIKDFDHENVGDTHFYWSKTMSDEESKRIADYILQQGAFSGAYAEIIMTVENGRTVIRFPVEISARTDAQYHATIESVAKEIKDKLFPGAPFSFHLTDEKMNSVKSWDY